MRKETIYIGVRAEYFRKRVYLEALLATVFVCVVMFTAMLLYHTTSIQTYINTISTMELETQEKIAAVEQSYQSQIDSLNSQITTLTEQVNQRSAESSELFELARKYWYVFRDASDNSGLTMDDIVYLDDICKESDINPHLMWCIYDHESGYTAVIDNYSGSSARGIGQVLASTGKSYYENILQLGTYSHDYAYDVQTNMLITVTMIARNISSGIENAIALYSGDSSGGYLQTLYSIADDHDVDITQTSYQ